MQITRFSAKSKNGALSMTSKLIARGFSLIEVLVTIALIALLIALLLPAVQNARDAAQRVQCQNNLRQIGIGLQNYHTAHSVYPLRFNEKNSSLHVLLLPYVEQSVLYNNINFSVPLLYSNVSWSDMPDATFNTVANTKLSMFICPSDSAGSRYAVGNSYRCNIGVGPSEWWSNENADSGNGFFTNPGCSSAQSIVDGLSHTVAFCERLMGSRDKSSGLAERDFYQLNAVGDYVAGKNADYALSGCKIAAKKFGYNFAYHDAGTNWSRSGLLHTHYNHAQGPNGIIPDAVTDVYAQPWGIATARSWHNGGVEALLGDGSIRWMKDSTAIKLWRALGTRNGGETID